MGDHCTGASNPGEIGVWIDRNFRSISRFISEIIPNRVVVTALPPDLIGVLSSPRASAGDQLLFRCNQNQTKELAGNFSVRLAYIAKRRLWHPFGHYLKRAIFTWCSVALDCSFIANKIRQCHYFFKLLCHRLSARQDWQANACFQPVRSSAVAKLVNIMIFWKRMNRFGCQLSQTVHGRTYGAKKRSTWGVRRSTQRSRSHEAKHKICMEAMVYRQYASLSPTLVE